MEVQIQETKSKGRGVFAAADIKSGEQHVSEGIRIDITDIRKTSPLWLYVFGSKNPTQCIFSSDWCNYINCDREHPNMRYDVAEDNRSIIFTALRDIAKGEEITIDYGYDVEAYAAKLGIDLKSWNGATGSMIKLTPSEDR